MNRLDRDIWICDAQAAIGLDSGGSSTQQVTPQPTEEQTQLTAAQVDLAHQQLDELKKQDAFNQQLQDAFGPLLPDEAALLKQQLADANNPDNQKIKDASNQLTLMQLASAQKNQPIQDEILQLQLDNLKNGGAATPQQAALIDEATKQGIASGTANINQWVSDATKQIAQQLAPQLGLRPTDQPIVDRAGEIAKSALTQVGGLTSNLEAANATAKLNLPLATQQVQSGVGTAAAGLQNAQQSFAQQLAQQAYMNRLQLFGGGNSAISGAGSLGLGLAGIGPNFNLGQMGSTSTTTNNPSFMQSYGGLISSGIGAIGAVAMMSSRSVKDRRAATDAEAVLRAIAGMDIDRWTYRGDSAEHVGPYAEDFRAAFGLGDGRTIHLVDAIGVLFAAVKALAQREAVPA